MKPDLKELINQLKKYNPTFSDTDIRSHLINMGNAPQAVDEALGIASSMPAQSVSAVTPPSTPPSTPQPSQGFMPQSFVGMSKVTDSPYTAPKAVVPEGPLDPAQSVKFFDERITGQRQVMPNGQIVVPKKSHKGGMLLLITLIILAVFGYLFYSGVLSTTIFTNNKLYLDTRNKVIDFFGNFKDPNTNTSSNSQTNTTPRTDTNQMIASSTTNNMTEPNVVDDRPANEVSVFQKIDTQVYRVNRVKSALNIYASVYGVYPNSLSDLASSTSPNPKITTKLPALSQDDITDMYSGREYIYKKDAKTGFSFVYIIDIPEPPFESSFLYSVLDYRIAYNAKLKKYYSVPIIKFVNGTNTATRDAMSVEALSAKISDANKNIIPDIFERQPIQAPLLTSPAKK